MSLISNDVRPAKKGLTRRRGACESCDGKAPCCNCAKATEKCLYLKAKTTRRRRLAALGQDGTQESQATTKPANEPQLQLMTNFPAGNATNVVNPLMSPSLSGNTFSPAGINEILDVSMHEIDIPLSDSVHDFPYLSPFQFNDYEQDYLSNHTLPTPTSAVAPAMHDLAAFMQPPQTEQDQLLEDLSHGLLYDLMPTKLEIRRGAIQDQMYNINFCMDAIFSESPDCNTLDNDEHLKAKAGLKKLMDIQTESATLVENYHHLSVEYDQPINEMYIEACFQGLENVGCFLEVSSIKSLMEKDISHPPDVVELCLLNSVLALGCYYIDLGRDPIASAYPRKALDYFQGSLHRIEGLMLSKNNLIKFQALLLMATFAVKTGLRAASMILVQACHCSQALKLNDEQELQIKYRNNDEQLRARNAFWYLYSLEKPYCLNNGLTSMLDDDFIDHLPPKISGCLHLGSRDNNWTVANCQYAKICTMISKSLYSQTALRKSLEHKEKTMSYLHSLLDRWIKSLPLQYHSLASIDTKGSVLSQGDRKSGIKVLCQYHEAILAIYGPWVRIYATSLKASEKNLHLKCELTCAKSARTILFTTNDATALHLCSDFAVMRLCSVAVRGLFLRCVNGRGTSDDINYFAMACGIFAKLSSGADSGLAEVIDLTMIARKTF